MADACWCGCDWPPCARRGRCVGTAGWYLWRVLHPFEYRAARRRNREAGDG